MTEPQETRSFFWFTAERPVAISMMVAAALVFGFVGFGKLPVNLLPETTHPRVTIRTEYPGASPQDVEERISERIQDSVSVINGVRRVVSVSRPEVSDVILEFDWGTKMAFAVSDIRERLDRVRLPREADDPLVLRYDPSLDPVMTLGLTGDISLVELRRIAELVLEQQLKQQVDGVAAVKLRGGQEEEIHIAVDEDALALFGLDVQVIGQRLAAENLNAAAGLIEEGKTEYLVRTLNQFKNLEQIRRLVLERRDNVSIRLQDVATVTRQPMDREVISRIDGRECVLVDVYKEASANIVRLCERVRERAFGTQEQLDYVLARKHEEPLPERPEIAADDVEQEKQRKKGLRAARARKLRERARMTNYLAFNLQQYGVELDLLQDQSRFIQASVQDVLNSALVGGLFAIFVIYLFLRRFAATAILFVSIPVSLVATFAPMYMSEIDMNIMSLGGLALGVGMLVDNSIVVLESIARAREQGHGLKPAAVLGVSRVASAVTASTLTTVAVFFPIVFVEGVAGQLFHDQALTVVYALLMSLVVALFVIPMLATRRVPGEFERPGSKAGNALQAVTSRGMALVVRLVGLLGKLLWLVLLPFAVCFDFCYRNVTGVYPGLLRTALRHRLAVVVIALALLALAISRIQKLGNELLPQVNQGELFVDTFLSRDATVERTDSVMSQMEREIHGLSDVRSTFLACGVDKEELNDSDQGEHSARTLVRLVDTRNRARQEENVRRSIREIVRRYPEVVSFRFARPSVLSFSAPIVVEVFGEDLFDLRRACQEVEEAVRKVPGLRDVRSTLQRGNTELSIRLDRDKLAALGLDSGQVARILQNKIQGDVPTLFQERERKIDMRVRLARSAVTNMSRLLAINVNPKGQPPIPLSSVASVQRREGPSEIRQISQRRGAEVQATLTGFDLGSAQDRVAGALVGLRLPRGIKATIGGQKAEMERGLGDLLMALLLAVFLVYIVMASQFESLVQPLVILVTLPLALVGVIFTLEWLDTPLSVVVFLGAIVLAGIVVNNAIILIDQINRLRAEGTDKLTAIVEGARIRLRPVLMTTVTTVLGLLPLTGWLFAGEGLELRAPMAITVVCGLTVSTILTLVVVPVVYSLSDRRP
ncbi:MAG: efflux RND transporter permease subunit [Planctomycetota bacterium]|jgi:HAE1 family hydrophobic/amphiphilic exporter-1